MHGWYWDGWWGGWVMMIGMIVFWLGVLALVVWLIRGWLAPGRHGASESPAAGHPPAPADEAVALVKRRYAAGEIGREEYVEKLRDLGAPGPDR